MDGLLKRACDQCTRSKVKCSGTEPCKRCSSREIDCVYRPKRKRGPQKRRGASGAPVMSSKATAKRRAVFHGNTSDSADNDEVFSVVSSYERRIWSVFFTIFKNQNRTREEHPWAWCWFASQLEKLRSHLNKQNNTGALTRLQTWLEALDMDQTSVNQLVMKKCTFDPSRCGTCSAAALGLRAPGAAPGTPTGPVMLSYSVDGQVARPLLQGEIQTKQMVCSLPTAIVKPVLIFDSDDNQSVVNVNAAFSDNFGYNSDEMTALLSWSGGGFLPWGGDLMARLLVREADLIIFLQILALKFQSLGVPSHSEGDICCREVPSTHVFWLWAKDKNGSLGLVQECFLRCLHLERLEGGRLATQMRVIVETIGEAVPAIADHVPVYKAPIYGLASPSASSVPLTPPFSAVATTTQETQQKPMIAAVQDPWRAAATPDATNTNSSAASVGSSATVPMMGAASTTTGEGANGSSMALVLDGGEQGTQDATATATGYMGEWTRHLLGDSSTNLLGDSSSDLLGDAIPPTVKNELEWSVFDNLPMADDDTFIINNNNNEVTGAGLTADTALPVGGADAVIPSTEQEQEEGDDELGEYEGGDDEDDDEGDAMIAEGAVDVDWLNSLLEWTVQQPVDT